MNDNLTETHRNKSYVKPERKINEKRMTDCANKSKIEIRI